MLRSPKPEVNALVGDSLGKQLQRRRRELGLRRIDVAEIIGCDPKSLMWWETDVRSPSSSMYPPIISFLGYEPWPEPMTLPDQLRAERLRRGLVIKQAADVIGVDECTFKWWESGRWTPRRRGYNEKVRAFLGC